MEPPEHGREVPSLAAYRAGARAWLATNMEPSGTPVAAGSEAKHRAPAVIEASRERQRRLFDAGYAGIDVPVAYGGQGLPAEHREAFEMEAAQHAMPDFGTLATTTFRVCVPLMLEHGDPDFLADFIPTVLSGQALVCQFFSEPSSGSDLASVRTRAVRRGDEWVITGQKTWTSLANVADWGMCLARTDWDVPKHEGLTWFAVRCDSPNLTVRPITQIDGSADFCEAFFDDVVVPARQQLGPTNGGWPIAQAMLVRERTGGRIEDAASSIGPGSPDPFLVGLARRRGRLGDPIARQQIAEAHIIAFVERALARRIGEMGRRTSLTPGIAAYTKLFRGTFDPVRARLALEIDGGAGLAWHDGEDTGPELTTTLLRGRVQSVGGGTNEMQRNAIAERVLGMPREHSADSGVPFKDLLRSTDQM